MVQRPLPVKAWEIFVDIFYQKLGNKALVVTARDMNRRERRRYEKK